MDIDVIFIKSGIRQGERLRIVCRAYPVNGNLCVFNKVVSRAPQAVCDHDSISLNTDTIPHLRPAAVQVRALHNEIGAWTNNEGGIGRELQFRVSQDQAASR